MTPRLITNPEAALEAMGLGFSITLSITFFVITADALKKPEQYEGYLYSQSVTAFGVVGTYAHNADNSIRTYGVGRSIYFGMGFNAGLFGASAGIANYIYGGVFVDSLKDMFSQFSGMVKETASGMA